MAVLNSSVVPKHRRVLVLDERDWLAIRKFREGDYVKVTTASSHYFGLSGIVRKVDPWLYSGEVEFTVEEMKKSRYFERIVRAKNFVFFYFRELDALPNDLKKKAKSK